MLTTVLNIDNKNNEDMPLTTNIRLKTEVQPDPEHQTADTVTMSRITAVR
jgi:hypothetical protein